MISYKIHTYKKYNIGEITSVLTTMPLSESKFLEIEFFSIGAGIRRISYIDNENSINKLLTLSYDDIFESCHNPSLAGLTIGPNAGRLEANKNITLSDDNDSISVYLPANEEGTKQIHGGMHKISDVNWGFEGVDRLADDSLSIAFICHQVDGIDGWPGNRSYSVIYRIYETGILEILLNGTTDMTSYINLTNHTYWLRNSLSLTVNTNTYIKNRDDCIPAEVISIDNTDQYSVGADDILNNAFLLNDKTQADVTLEYANIPLHISLSTDAPAIMVYTGDYLDEYAEMYNGKVSAKACAIALEPQELYPFTKTTLTTEDKPFKRNITYSFTL